jgi:hypothetical protein
MEAGSSRNNVIARFSNIRFEPNALADRSTLIDITCVRMGTNGGLQASV